MRVFRFYRNHPNGRKHCYIKQNFGLPPSFKNNTTNENVRKYKTEPSKRILYIIRSEKKFIIIMNNNNSNNHHKWRGKKYQQTNNHHRQIDRQTTETTTIHFGSVWCACKMNRVILIRIQIASKYLIFNHFKSLEQQEKHKNDSPHFSIEIKSFIIFNIIFLSNLCFSLPHFFTISLSLSSSHSLYHSLHSCNS